MEQPIDAILQEIAHGLLALEVLQFRREHLAELLDVFLQRLLGGPFSS